MVFLYHCQAFKGTCSPWKSWASDRKLLTRAPEKNESCIRVAKNPYISKYQANNLFNLTSFSALTQCRNWSYGERATYTQIKCVTSNLVTGPVMSEMVDARIFRKDIEPNKWFLTMKNELIYCRFRNIECWKYKLWFWMKIEWSHPPEMYIITL